MNCIKFDIRISKKIILCAVILMTAAALSANELAVGQAAPDFTFMSAIPAKQQKLSDYRGKPVALHFWAAWCGPCVRELPLISALSSSKSDDITVLAVNCGETDRYVSSFLSKRKLRLNIVMDRDSSISALYNIDAIPQTFMIDSDGVIRSIRVGSYTKAELDRDVSAMLK
jgi:peroxiredoxin